MTSNTQQNINKAISSHTGKTLFPLRIFLGVMFIYAAFTKLTDASFFDPASPNGVASQMRASASSSPIGGILNRLIEHSTLLGYAIAVSELLIGLGILVGIWTQFAAIGLAVISVSFLLTVSWGTTPYFLNPDLAYLAAVLPLAISGDGGYRSLEVSIRNRIKAKLVTSTSNKKSGSLNDSLIARRAFVQTGVVAGGLGLVGVASGLVGQKLKGTSAPIAAPTTPALPTNSPTNAAVSGTRIAAVSDVPVGTAFQFIDPASGSPAYLMQPAAGTFIAYSAVCTHEGCIVNDNVASGTLNCPCHGAQFDAATGAHLKGPSRGDLAKLMVSASGPDIYLT